MQSEEKLLIKYTMFGSLAGGGYMRVFESVSHVGISGVISKGRNDKQEKRVFVFNEKEYSTSAEVLNAYNEDKNANRD